MARHLTAAGFDPSASSNGERGPRAAALRAAGRLRARPDAPGPRRLEADRDTPAARESGRRSSSSSARGTEHDRVHALEIGADDYLVKPFSMKELVARVRRRRTPRDARPSRSERGEAIEIEELRIDPARGAGVRRRRERRPDADRVPAPLRARARAAAASSRATSCSSRSGAGARRTATGPSTSSSASCARRSTGRAPHHTFIQTRYGVGYKLEPQPK